MPELITKSRIRELLHDHPPADSLGQNFLADPNTARRIVRLAELSSEDHVIEIGPGFGSLTLALTEVGVNIRVLEIDRYLLPLLEDELHRANVEVDVRQGDALSCDYNDLLADAGQWVLVSNLPYNVATPIIMRVAEDEPKIRRALVMVQSEMAQRWCAKVGDDLYGFPSVKLQYFGEMRIVGTVPPTVFIPQPKVESALVSFQRHVKAPVNVDDLQTMLDLARTGFMTRRKMLRGALRPLLGEDVEEILTRAGVAPTSRAEELGLEEWAAVANELHSRRVSGPYRTHSHNRKESS